MGNLTGRCDVLVIMRYMSLAAMLIFLITLQPPAWGIALMVAIIVAAVGVDVLVWRRRRNSGSA